MNEPPYSRFSSSELSLRDELAIDRTILANERTLLAYLRSGVALLIAGVSIMQFAEAGWFRNIGIACLPFGVLSSVIGVIRFRRMAATISQLRRGAETASEQTLENASVPSSASSGR